MAKALSADEPTSGLDSFQATQVIKTLRELADQGKTVVVVLHQPSQQAFQLFDDLLLISEGRQMYFGEVADVRRHMQDLGYPCEPEVGTAEHVLDCISYVAGADAEATRRATERIDRIAAAAVKQAQALDVSRADDRRDGEGGSTRPSVMRVAKAASHPGANLLRQFRLLMTRSLRELVRGKLNIFIKVAQQVFLGVIYGGIYTLGNDQASIMDRFGLLSLIIIGATNMAMVSEIAIPRQAAFGELAKQPRVCNVQNIYPQKSSTSMTHAPMEHHF